MPNPFKSLYNYFVKAFDKKIDKMEVKRKKREADLAEIYPNGLPCENEEMVQRFLQGHESLPPCDAKNPYRFL